MDYNKYEFELLIEAIVASLTKDKRPRGECYRLFIGPIREVPEYFKDTIVYKGDFNETKTHN